MEDAGNITAKTNADESSAPLGVKRKKFLLERNNIKVRIFTINYRLILDYSLCNSYYCTLSMKFGLAIEKKYVAYTNNIYCFNYVAK